MSYAILSYAGFILGCGTVCVLPKPVFTQYFGMLSGRIQEVPVNIQPSPNSSVQPILTDRETSIITAMRSRGVAEDFDDISGRFDKLKEHYIKGEEQYIKEAEKVDTQFDDEVADYRAAKAVLKGKGT